MSTPADWQRTKAHCNRPKEYLRRPSTELQYQAARQSGGKRQSSATHLLQMEITTARCAGRSRNTEAASIFCS